MIGWLQRNQKILLYVAAIAFLGLSAIAAFISPSGAWPLAGLAVVLVLAANADRFSEISAGSSGFSAKIREAQTTINEMREMIEVIASAELHQLQSSSRWGGNRDEDLKLFLKRIVDLMVKVGIPTARIEEIKAESWDRYVRFDYVHSILGGSYVPAKDDPEMKAEWKKLGNFDNIPSPAKLAAFLAKHGDQNEDRAKLLEAYEHYWTTGKHISDKLWEGRHKVPQLHGELRDD